MKISKVLFVGQVEGCEGMKVNLQEPKKENAGCGWYIASFLISPFTVLWWAYVASLLYSWFLASLSGAPQLTVIHWVGAGCLRMMFMRMSDKYDASPEVFSRAIAFGLVGPALTLYVAYVLRLILGVA